VVETSGVLRKCPAGCGKAPEDSGGLKQMWLRLPENSGGFLQISRSLYDRFIIVLKKFLFAKLSDN